MKRTAGQNFYVFDTSCLVMVRLVDFALHDLSFGGIDDNSKFDFFQTKFIQAIVSNNTTDDHCREFRQHDGIPALLGLLRLPALPLDFPNSSACQSVTNLMHTVFVSIITGLKEYSY